MKFTILPILVLICQISLYRLTTYSSINYHFVDEKEKQCLRNSNLFIEKFIIKLDVVEIKIGKYGICHVSLNVSKIKERQMCRCFGFNRTEDLHHACDDELVNCLIIQDPYFEFSSIYREYLDCCDSSSCDSWRSSTNDCYNGFYTDLNCGSLVNECMSNINEECYYFWGNILEIF